MDLFLLGSSMHDGRFAKQDGSRRYEHDKAANVNLSLADRNPKLDQTAKAVKVAATCLLIEAPTALRKSSERTMDCYFALTVTSRLDTPESATG